MTFLKFANLLVYLIIIIFAIFAIIIGPLWHHEGFRKAFLVPLGVFAVFVILIDSLRDLCEYLQFLANDVTKVTSVANVIKAQKNGPVDIRYTIYDIRYTMYGICLRLWSRGGILWDIGWGSATGTLKPFLSAVHAHTAYTVGVRLPGFEVFCDHQELFNVTSGVAGFYSRCSPAFT